MVLLLLLYNKYYGVGDNLRDLPKEGQKIASQPDFRLKEGSPLFVKYPLNDSPKLAKNIAAKSTKIGRHSKLE